MHRLDMNLPKRALYHQLATIGEGVSGNAYPPFSDYPVGAAVLLWDGRVYFGVNSENPSIDLTIHGEMSAINAAISDGALEDAKRAGLDQFTFIKAVAIMPRRMFNGWPCGHCCDYISGFGVTMDIVVRRPDGGVDWKPMSKVLPKAPDARTMIELTRSGHLLDHVRCGNGQGDCSLKSFLPVPANTRSRAALKACYKELLARAKAAGERSYAPYTKRPAGAAVWLWDGSVYTGSRVENVGYTRSNQPEQCAIEAAIADGALSRAIASGVSQFDFVRAVAYAPLGQPDIWPTGSSRQCLCDFGSSLSIVIEDAVGEPVSRTLKQLYPAAFVPDFLSYWTAEKK